MATKINSNISSSKKFIATKNTNGKFASIVDIAALTGYAFNQFIVINGNIKLTSNAGNTNGDSLLTQLIVIPSEYAVYPTPITTIVWSSNHVVYSGSIHMEDTSVIFVKHDWSTGMSSVNISFSGIAVRKSVL